jgi:hypothetical protein
MASRTSLSFDVINIHRSLNAGDARLHRASCHWVNGAPPRGDGFVGSYLKVCSDSLADLDAWASERVRQRGLGAAGEALVAPADREGAYEQWVLTSGEGAVTEAEVGRLVEACRPLPTRKWEYEEHDYVTNVLLTVLDLQMRNVTVERSIRHYRDFRWDEVRTSSQAVCATSGLPPFTGLSCGWASTRSSPTCTCVGS